MGRNDTGAERNKIESWLLKTGITRQIIEAMQMPPEKAAEVAAYQEATAQMYAISGDAEKIIGIIVKDIERIPHRTTILEYVVRDIAAGADYSECRKIENIFRMFATAKVRKLIMAAAPEKMGDMQK